MNKWRFILLTALLTLLFGCKQEAPVTINAMLSTVPSDAIAVVTGDRLRDVLQNMEDSTHVLRKLNYGTLLKKKAALSFCYTSSLTPVLTIDAGRQATDSSEALQPILDRAAQLKLSARLIPGSEFGQKGGILAISQSETLTASVERHLKSGASIQDAPFFTDALALAAGGHNAIFLKNAGALRWLPKNAMNGLFTNRETAAFLKDAAQWIVITPTEENVGEFRMTGADSPACYHKVLASLKKNQLKILEVAPADADFVLAQSVEDEQFRPLYEAFQDACVKLDRYKKNLDEVKRSVGKYPLDAEKEMGIKEVALMRWENHKVSLLRCSSSIKDTLVAENPYPGIIPALYGNAFRTEDGWTCRRGSWRAYGNREDVEAFATLPPVEDTPKAHSFYYRNSNVTILTDNRGTRIWK